MYIADAYFFIKVPVKIPEAFAEPGKPHLMYKELPVKYSDVRLVYPLPDPETGILRDTVVANIQKPKIWFDKRNRSKRWDRLIPGMEGIIIPWPTKEKPEPIDQLGDTRIMDVEEITFIPTLVKPPFPVGVIDELRNKYSRFRTRHDDQYLAKKEAEDLERQLKEGARVLMPVQEINRRAREERKALGKPVLPEEMLEKIGRIMAQNRPELLVEIQAVPAVEEAVV